MNLQVTDSSFAQCFKVALKEIELNPHGPYHQEFSNKSDTYQVAAQSKDFYEWYQNLSLDYIQDFLETREMKKEFIRGIYESEGSFYRKGHRWSVSICSTDLEFLKFIKSMIKKIGFECLKINEKGQKKQLNNHQFTAYRIRIKGGASKIIEFLKEINPCISRKSLESIDFSDQRGIRYPRNRWSEEEEDFLRENYEKNEMTVKKICKKLGRSKSSVTGKAHLMGLSKFSIPKENKQE